MKMRIENCSYELIKDILLSLDSLVIDVKKDKNGMVITLKDRQSGNAFLGILKRGPLYQMTQNARISFL